MLNILGIASFMPIPNLKIENDVILRLYEAVISSEPGSSIKFILPVSFPFPLRSLFNGRWLRYMNLIKQGDYRLGGHLIRVLPGIWFSSPPQLQIWQSNTFFQFNRTWLQRYCAENQIGYIHANRGLPDGHLAMQLSQHTGIPYGITFRKEIDHFEQKSLSRLMHQIARGAQSITTPTTDMADYLRPIYGGKLFAIPHGVEPYFIVEEGDRVPGQNRLLTVARLLKLKNIDKVMRILRLLKREYDFHYTLVGDGPEREALLNLAEQLDLTDRFTHIPRVPYTEMPEVYGRHDAFIMPSYPETFGRVYFEAMAAGLPILCANQYAVNGFFEEGRAGFSVDPDDEDLIQQKISYFLHSPDTTARMGRHAREQVRHYTWDFIGRQYLEIWTDTYHARFDNIAH